MSIMSEVLKEQDEMYDGTEGMSESELRNSMTEPTYRIIRFYKNKPNRVILTGLTLKQAQNHCQDPSTTYGEDWFDEYKMEVK